MAPLLTKAEYARRTFFDVAPSSIHIKDLIHKETRYNDRTSDLVTGMLLLAVYLKVITKVEASWYAAPFTIGARLRVSVYQHEGNAFLGPDGQPMSIAGQLFHGSGGPTLPSQYTFETMRDAPNFQQWLDQTLYRGTTSDDSDSARRGEVPPKRKVNGARVDALASSTSSSATSASSSSRNRERSSRSSSQKHKNSKGKKDKHRHKHKKN